MPSTIDRFNALAIDCDISARIRLKQATSSIFQFKSILLLGEISDAREEMRSSQTPFDVIFLSYRLDPKGILDFMTDAKQSKNCCDAAFIQLQPLSDDQNVNFASSCLEGFNGVLVEPYSIDALIEITNLAAKIKKEHKEAREKKAINLLLNDIVKSVNRMAYIQSCDMSPDLSFKNLKKNCKTFQNLDEEQIELYFQCAIEKFLDSKPVENDPSVGYTGISKRIKKAMIRHILTEEEANEKKDLSDIISTFSDKG